MMQNSRRLLCALGTAAFLVSGCETNVSAPEDGSVVDIPSFAGALPRPSTWVDGELFDGVVTPATFNPASEPFDELYALGNGFTFKDGAPLISESKPGDQGYNGGRWHLNLLNGVAPAKYANADGVGDLDLGDFVSTDQYFECPLLPRRGNR